MNPSDHPHLAAEPVLRAAFGAQAAQILYVAAKLGVADKLQHGEASTTDLARSLGADPPALERVLRALVVMGVCNEPLAVNRTRQFMPSAWRAPARRAGYLQR